MLCDKCKKRKATTYFSKSVNGVRVEKHLCAACAAEEELGGGLFDMLSTVFGESAPASVPGAARCELCGRTFDQIAQTGRLGCANCYRVFSKELRPSLQRIHGTVKHVGKRSGAGGQPKEPKERRLAALKRELQASITDEAYEKAAALRDEIRRLETDGQ